MPLVPGGTTKLAVGDEDLLAVDYPVAVLADGVGLHRGDIGAGVGLSHRKRAQGRVLDGAVAGRNPGRDLLWRALREDRGDRQPGPLDGQGDAGAAPGQLLGDDGGHDPGGVGVRLLQEIDAVKAHLRRLLDDRPGELLGFVVVDRHRPDLLLGEGVDPIPDLTLLVTQLERNHLRS
jgi:hypothetical protein